MTLIRQSPTAWATTMAAYCKAPRFMHIDLETYSSVDLAECGVYKYAESEDFEILLFGYTFDDDEVQVL